MKKRMKSIAVIAAAGLLGSCTPIGGGGGCAKDSDCKGDRVCVAGACVDPGGGGPAPGGHGQSAPGVNNQGAIDRAAAAIRGPQVLADEEIAISAGGWQDRSFSLPTERRIEVITEGRKHADKGFSVYVIEDVDFPAFQAKKEFRQVSAFEGLKVRSFGHTGTLPAGSWHFVVMNSENILNTMVVHLKITADPK
jgi:hypothetical protein